MLKTYGRGAVSEFLYDRIIYRNLVPVDRNLPALEDVQKRLGVPPGRIPRKTETDYARVVVELLKTAQHMHAPGQTIQNVVFIGDTLLNDGTAFDNICWQAGWKGVAFIGVGERQPLEVQVCQTPHGYALYQANQWQALAAFEQFCCEQRISIGERTALLLDLDKTVIGARGRNDHLIDQARFTALQRVIQEVFGLEVEQSRFQAAYEQLRQAEFHPLTEDNQDYLAYICLIVGSGSFDLRDMMGDFRSGRLQTFRQFMQNAEEKMGVMQPGLRDLHQEVSSRVLSEDPTPFKRFRNYEYQATITKMGHLTEDIPPEQLLSDEIVITQEVSSLAIRWGECGALLFGLSDKPDEASIPSAELAKQGWMPIHRQPTHVVGYA
jgi:hypothetical protein